ncbi:MAG: cell division ATP-binding protein FtsE [Candidatus Eremiobacteraeota bacterium]|nr:cell division ATP-binding protein FtsE [Candidatus Eremiobacteraeota bacterium]
MIEMHNINLVYRNGVQALSDINLYVEKGEFIFLVGSTGSGKSSLLKLIYREVVPSSGDIYVNDRDITDMKRREVPYLRRMLGVVFQDFKLIPQKTVYENVAYALEVTGTKGKEIAPRVHKVLELVNLEGKAKRFPGELSGGEQQRTSLARALVNSPLILLADEPTGNLDPESSWEIMQLLHRINQQATTVLMATHNREVVDLMKKRVVVLSKGRISVDQERGSYFPIVGEAQQEK